jgi:hypothetical protein
MRTTCVGLGVEPGAVDPESTAVRVAIEAIRTKPATTVAMTQRNRFMIFLGLDGVALLDTASQQYLTSVVK